MSSKEFLVDKLPYLIMNFIIYILIAIILLIARMPVIILFLIFMIWFFPLGIYIILQFFKEKKFYDSISIPLSELDKKYLIPEIVKRPNYYEGSIFYDVLKECSRDMHEHVNLYKNFQEEYREYIETWVHEIKTPIASLKLIVENSESRDKNVLLNEIEKIEQYVNQALYYSRSNDVSKDYIVREFSIKDIVNSCIINNRRDFISNKIFVSIKDVDVTVVSDAKWVKFIINQIIINSIKYRNDENPKINFYTLREENKINLVIEDNGIGIPKSDINRVFDKGFTGENGRRYGKSTGIGLYLCKKLCSKLGLDINLESKVLKGTKIIISFNC